MAGWTERALVLRGFASGEAAGRYVLLGERSGRFTARAPGVRKGRSRLGGSLEPLNFCTLQLVPGRGAPTITSAQAETVHRHIKEDIVGFAAASCGLELVYKSAPSGPEGAVLLPVALAFFARLDHGGSALATLVRFAADLLGAMGWGVAWGRCSRCGGPLSGPAYYVAHAGELTHPGCGRNGLELSESGRAFLAGDTEVLPPEVGAHLFGLICLTWQAHLDGEIASESFARRMLLVPPQPSGF